MHRHLSTINLYSWVNWVHSKSPFLHLYFIEYSPFCLLNVSVFQISNWDIWSNWSWFVVIFVVVVGFHVCLFLQAERYRPYFILHMYIQCCPNTTDADAFFSPMCTFDDYFYMFMFWPSNLFHCSTCLFM